MKRGRERVPGLPGEVGRGIGHRHVGRAELGGDARDRQFGADGGRHVVERRLLGIGQQHAVLGEAGHEHARHVRAALGDVEVVERVVRAAEDIGHDLLEELAAEIEGRREGVVTVAAAADAVARFEHDGPHPERS